MISKTSPIIQEKMSKEKASVRQTKLIRKSSTSYRLTSILLSIEVLLCIKGSH
jgi:hypothetical protein